MVFNSVPNPELNKFLWAYKKHSFPPHGRDDESLADAQPIVLSTNIENIDDADIAILVTGAHIGDVSKTVRCITILDGIMSKIGKSPANAGKQPKTQA